MVDTLIHPSNKPVDLVFPIANIITFYKMDGLSFIPPFGEDNLKGHKKLFASLRCFPMVSISQIRPSMQMKPYYQEIEQSVCYLSGQLVFCCCFWFCHNHACRSVHVLTWGLVTPVQYMVLLSQHFNWNLVELNKGTIEDLAKAKKLQHLLDLWAYTIDTSNPDDKYQFEFLRYMEVASFSCHPSHSTQFCTCLYSKW